MRSSLWSIWNSVAGLGLARLTKAELALLILLGASLLAVRAFRERYLKIWIVGWIALVGSRMVENVFVASVPAPYGPMVEQGAFVLAVGLLAGAVLLYARSRDLIVPLAVITPILVGFAGARALMWPDLLPLRVALEVGYRIVFLTAAIALLRSRRGRREPASWLLALCLPCLHLPWSPFTDRIPVAIFTTLEVALGMSMLLVVFDEARARTRRLSVVHGLTAGIVSAQQYGNMVQTALDELHRMTRIKAAWFRLLEGGHMVATHAVGVSPDFLRDAGFAEVTEEITQLLEHAQPHVTKGDAVGTDSA
jgi:hypothetical protein